MNPSAVWLWGAAGMMASLVPCGIATFRGAPGDRLAALEAAGTIMALVMVLLAQGYHRLVVYDLALTFALLAFGGGMVFARFLERWR